MSLVHHHTDENLLDLLKTNSREAFTEIYKRYWDRMYIVAYNKLGNTEDAEEIIQDIFLDLWKRRKTLEISKTLEGYLATAVKYKVINWMAVKNRIIREELNDAHENILFTQPGWIDFADFQKQLTDTVERLPEKCRLVFKLSRSEGLSHKEIASRLGIAKKTVESHLSRALSSLRSALNNFFTFFF